MGLLSLKMGIDLGSGAGGGGASGTPILWMKADSLSLNDGDPVSSWVSSEGNSRNLTAADAKRPTFKTSIQNSLPAVRFNGSNFIQAGNVGTAYNDQYLTMQVVVNPTANINSDIFHFCNDPTVARETGEGTIGPSMLFKRNSNPDHSPELLQGGNNNWAELDFTLAVFTIVKNGIGVSYSSYKNTTLQTPARGSQNFNNISSDLDTFRFGDINPAVDQYPFTGDLFEFVYYDSVLSEADRNANVAYLQAKWGIT